MTLSYKATDTLGMGIRLKKREDIIRVVFWLFLNQIHLATPCQIAKEWQEKEWGDGSLSFSWTPRVKPYSVYTVEETLDKARKLLSTPQEEGRPRVWFGSALDPDAAS